MLTGCTVEIEGYIIRYYIDQCGGPDKLFSVNIARDGFAVCTDGRRVDYVNQ